MADDRIQQIIIAAEELRKGNFAIEIPQQPLDEVGRLGQALKALAKALDKRYQELQKLTLITVRINSGLLLDQILDDVYADFKEIIPYNRIGFSLLEDGGQNVKARWAKTDQPEIFLKVDHAAPLAGSTLQTILETQKPRVINDLKKYLSEKPSSESTELIVREGMRSSLTCPLIANGIPVGFMFFSSIRENTYSELHVEIYQRIAAQLSVIVEKGRLVSDLAGQKDRIEQQNRELIKLDELKNSFLGMAAHDLRTPIGNIKMLSSLLLNPTFPINDADRQEFTQDIHQQAVYMIGLLDELLDVTRIETGKIQLQKTEIDVPDFMEEACHRHQQLANPKGTTILLEKIPSGNLQADPMRLRQVLDNLISNAVKYSPPGSKVWVRVKKNETEWRIEIKDEGPGIKQSDREKLFKDFARLSAKPTGGEKSTGLGLAITRRLVETHGGRIGVESEEEKGAIFWFTLPLLNKKRSENGRFPRHHEYGANSQN